MTFLVASLRQRQFCKNKPNLADIGVRILSVISAIVEF